MRPSPSALCLSLLALTPWTPAQRTSTWAPVRRTVHYEMRLINPTAQVLTDIDVHLPLPAGDARQEIHYLHLTGPNQQGRFVDRHGQELVKYHLDRLEPGTAVDLGYLVGCTLQHVHWRHPERPEAVGGPALTDQQRRRYLEARRNYSMDSPLMQETARKLTAGTSSQWEKLLRIHDHIVGRVRYVRDDRWDPAAKVLARGTGSCSEYNYLLSGLCRLAGLPTRYVGGSTNGLRPIPFTDMVYHRWTEVFIDGVGWYPVDCSRDANPLRGNRSHLGRVYHDALVWCRQGGGGRDLLGWEYRGKARVKGSNKGLKCSHRTRWLPWIETSRIAAARRWMAGDARGPAPAVAAVDAVQLDWHLLSPAGRIRAIRALAAGGCPAAIRRALSSRLPAKEVEGLLDSLCADPRLRREASAATAGLWQLRDWFRRREPAIRPTSGRPGMFTLESARPAVQRPDNWPGLAKATAERIVELLGGEPAPLALMPLVDQTGRPKTITTLAASLADHLGRTNRIIPGARFDQELEKAGIGRGQHWLYAMASASPLPPLLPSDFRPGAILVPIASLRKGRPRLEVKILLVKNCRYLKVKL